jgi:hypothetical protein
MAEVRRVRPGAIETNRQEAFVAEFAYIRKAGRNG